ncbi:MAG: ATP-binding protein [Phormidesmis sp.]
MNSLSVSLASSSSPTPELSKAGQRFLSRFKVSQRITTGFSLALGLAFAGTGAGIAIGNFYQSKALKTEVRVQTEISLLSQLQAGVLQARTHQQQLIPLSESPTDFQEEYSHILKHAETINSLLQSLEIFVGKSLGDRSSSDLVNAARIQEFLEMYDGIPQAYLKELDSLVQSIDPDTLNTSEKIETAQQRLLTFTNSELAIAFDSISDNLVSILEDANRQLREAQQAAELAQRLRNWIIVLSMVLSAGSAALLAALISRSISTPLKSMEATALAVTQSDDFDLQADVVGDDEVGNVAASFNLLLQRVNNLLLEQRIRTQELSNANQKLVSTQKQMIAQERLASLGSLSAGIAHEIKNPLNFVNNFSELSVELADELNEALEAQKEQLDPAFFADAAEIVDTLRANISKIDHHGKRADKIVANMLMHSRSGEVEWSMIDVNALVAEAVNLAYHGMRAKQSAFNLEFDNDYDQNLPLIRGSAQDLNRVFLNIASNACYAIYQRQLSEGNGFTPLLKVRTRNRGDSVEVYIRDNGTGMSPEIKSKIFDQFFTTKPTGEGTGLGMSLSYGIIVDQHCGQMKVASEVGRYTDFVVTLPQLKKGA